MAAILSLVPFVRMVGLNGSLARGEATEKSDIDFWIAIKSGRLWSGRALVTVVAHMTGHHRYRNKIAGRICLNTYQTEDHLAVGPKNQKNAKDYVNIQILYAAGNIADRFFKANLWVEKSGYRFKNRGYRGRISGYFALPIRWFFEAVYDLTFNDWGEKKFRHYQIKRILNDSRTQNSKAGQIYISDTELRFHPPKGKGVDF